MTRIEEKIQENLIDFLEIFEDGLEFLNKEHYVPNMLGTRGFVDILAKDSSGRYVIIELKRSDASSREAMHEVFKYIEGLKENKSLKDDELRVIIVSTEWRELLVPFSSFVKRVDCSVTGFHLVIDDAFKPLSAQKIIPLELNNDRLLSDQHYYRLYTTKENLEKGLQSHKDCFDHKRIRDYIILVLKAPEGFREMEIAATIQGLYDIADNFGSNGFLTSVERIEEVTPDFQFMLYASVQVLSKGEYRRIIETNSENWTEIQELEEVYESEEEILYTLHEYAVENAEPMPFGERRGISYPAKLSSALLDNQGWEILKVIRSGKFKANELLTDETIIEELRGSSGTNLQKYSKNFVSSNLSSFNELRKGVKNSLKDNPIWRNSLLYIINEVADLAQSEIFQGRLSIFNPSNTIYSIFRATQALGLEQAMLVVPNYFLLIEGVKTSRMYFGCFARNSKNPSLEKIIQKYYEGQTSNLLFPLNWGGYESQDYRIAAEFGLDYSTFLCISEESEKFYFKFDGFEFSSTNEIDPFSPFFKFIFKETIFVEEIVEVFEKHMITSGIFTF